MSGAVRHTYEIEHFFNTRGDHFLVIPAKKQGKLHIFPNGHCGKEIEKLENDAERVAAVARKFALTGAVQLEAIHTNLPRCRRVEAAEKVQQGAFAAAARASDRSKIPRREIERHSMQSLNFARSGGIGSRHIAEFDHGEECFRDAMTDQAEFRIIGETGDLLAVDKPAGLLVHPSKPGGPKTLWDGLRELLSYEIANGGQVSLINRLDRETSGIVLVAKTSTAARQAAIAMQEGKIRKTYRAIVTGHPAKETFTINAPILRRGEVLDTKIHLQRMVHPQGAAAVTEFRVLEKLETRRGAFSLITATPLTGRTHQIRVHAAHAGHPVVGDKIYGPSEDFYLEFIQTGWTPALAERLLLPRHALHSSGLALDWDGSWLEWHSGLPTDLSAFLDLLPAH
jgi:23S rRNA pseudouridine1911/1915/1917 synthase